MIIMAQEAILGAKRFETQQGAGASFVATLVLPT